MKEIKFRGKRKDNGEWVYGWLWKVSDTVFIKMQVDKFHQADYEVIPETVGQFTGRKDDDGNDIYEGDRINASWRDDYGGERVDNFVVYFDIKQSGFAPFANSPFDNRRYEYIKIIGNKFDNPELMEARK